MMTRIKLGKVFCDIGSPDRLMQIVLSDVAADVPSYVCFFNVHMSIEAQHNEQLMDAVKNARFVAADGKPIYILQRLSGFSNARQVRGPAFIHDIFAAAARDGIPIALIGASTSVLSAIQKRVELDGHKVDFRLLESPFGDDLTGEKGKALISRINASGAKLILVALGCPKQEIWMFRNSPSINGVLFGLGAAFDFYAGSKPEAPPFIRKLGLEWAHRLYSEPGRLWRRYLSTNIRFLLQCPAWLIENRIRGVNCEK